MRINSINFIPWKQFNFSDMETWQVEAISAEDDERDLDKEYLILNMLYHLPNDKQKIVLLMELLRCMGFKFDYGSISKSLGIKLRWYMRIKAKFKKILNKKIGHISEQERVGL